MSDNRLVVLAEVINSAVERGARDVRTVIPARVVKWDAAKQRANCKPLIKDVYEDEEGNRKTASIPVITGVPVQFMGAGGYRVTFPIEDGTLGSLFFAHASLDLWLNGDGREVDPELDYAHSIADAIFIPGLLPFGSPWESCPTDHMTIGKDDGVQAHFKSAEIALGDESGNDWVALAAKVGDELTLISSALSSLVAPAGGGTCTGNTYLTPGSVAASQVKAK